MSELPWRLNELGLSDPKSIVLRAAESGLLHFPAPVVKKSEKRAYHHWGSVKERTDYYNLKAKLKRAGL